ncbi:uncharacterized protein BKA78DRAFT_45011 [Phyllosticta capitalensis]|uniref:uncharacterized protein n=1 Tax=Phyllosticta capitalensis TaxID=121624 RepID=UPI0031321A8D
MTISTDGTCWYPDGKTIPDDVPCNTTAGENGDATACCGKDALCMANGLCLNWGILSRGSCTDNSWGKGCPQVCKDSEFVWGFQIFPLLWVWSRLGRRGAAASLSSFAVAPWIDQAGVYPGPHPRLPLASPPLSPAPSLFHPSHLPSRPQRAHETTHAPSTPNPPIYHPTNPNEAQPANQPAHSSQQSKAQACASSPARSTATT